MCGESVGNLWGICGESAGSPWGVCGGSAGNLRGICGESVANLLRVFLWVICVRHLLRRFPKIFAENPNLLQMLAPFLAEKSAKKSSPIIFHFSSKK